MTMTGETICDPPPWASAVEGFRYLRNQNGRFVARCVRCRVGFAITETSGEATWRAMVTHRDDSALANGAIRPLPVLDGRTCWSRKALARVERVERNKGG